ncbi:immunoglobulin-like domain-containing protein [Plantactinospora sp. CA-290183]|uniref:immunoglobulin-like domain-containing protein n=1 Tax=Plantactinospora sp. CA-290183 TaxID=3240006 RepID=UPI003D8EAFE5
MRALAALVTLGLAVTLTPATRADAAPAGSGSAAKADERIVKRAARALTVHNLDDVRGNLTLPTTGGDGTTVRWSSADPAVVSPTGEVHRPAPGEGGTRVRLTATVSRNAAATTRTFTARVPELPATQEFTGYAFSYFTGEGTADGEQVYFALSQGNDPLNWRELNGGRPVLTSELGERGLRDPFIIRSPEGDKFYQIATDLRIYGNGDWDAAQRTGSRSIMVWESTDLVNWTDQRLVRVSPDTAGNTWAPEAFYDEALGAYVVFWASKLYAEDDPDHLGDSYNRMMYATTRDFVTFTEPRVWIDPGYSVIDSTVIRHDGTYYRFTKDERNNTSSTPCSKFIIAERSADILDPSYDFVADCIGKGSISRGEGPTVFKSNTEEKWYLFIDEFGGRGYVPFESTDLASGLWRMSTDYTLPPRPRHGTVLPVTSAEYDRLLRAYGTA